MARAFNVSFIADYDLLTINATRHERRGDWMCFYKGRKKVAQLAVSQIRAIGDANMTSFRQRYHNSGMDAVPVGGW